jgi:glycosyltransferase involved in cell wall biosynthesis
MHLPGRGDVVIGRSPTRLSIPTKNDMSAIALVMIVRDEARCLARCVESARAWVDEIVVVDTGSTDATPDIARGLGARVGSFEWCDDFSAARNAALASTEAPWRLVLDADEWITAGGDSLAALRSLAPEFIGHVSVASAFDAREGGVGHAPSWLPRVLPRGVRYAGRIHEQPDATLPRRRLDLVVAHDGYLDVHKARKAGRNEQLLTLALGEAPDDA